MTTDDLPRRYRYIAELGQGGTARVIRVFDSVLGRDLALKLVHEEELRWLKREFNLLRQIRHENLVQVFEWGALPDLSAYYTMELVDGGDLGSTSQASKESTEVLALIAKVLRGIGHLHCHGEIHGDLKPSNVLLGRGGVVKVSDVGMGNRARGGQSASGTPGYTAPEVWGGGTVTERSDIYSVGVIAYEALTGVHPFSRRTIREVIHSQEEGWVASPASLGIALEPHVERSLMRALERDPGLRPASADELMYDLGLGENVGEILGGRFINRDAEMGRLREMATRQDKKKPTLLYLVGPHGVGKSALLSEVAFAHDVDCSSAAQEFNEAHNAVERGEPDHSITMQSHSERMSELASSLFNRTFNRPTFLTDDSPLLGDPIRQVARYLWAEAAERDVPSGVIFARTVVDPPLELEPHEAVVMVGALEAEGVYELIQGLLGRIPFDREFVERMRLETGGLPGSIVSAVLELIDKRFLWRRAGEWRVGQIPDSEWEQLKGGTSRRRRDWERLGEQERDLLTAVGLVEEGLHENVLERLDVDASTIVARLKSYGLVSTAREGVFLGSRDIGRVILDDDNAPRRKRMRDHLLQSIGVELPRTARARLTIAGEPSRGAITEGLWLGDYYVGAGQYSSAIRAFLLTLDSARALKCPDLAQVASLKAAGAFGQVGAFQEAVSLLEDDREWSLPGASDRSASRAMLLGSLTKGLGNVKAAEAYFTESSALAKERNPRAWLVAESELAEIQWRHGGQPGREAAANRIQTISREYSRFREFRDEWASLKYQLGASLVVEGKREAAIPILTEALELAVSDYWLMRINNALAAAHFYLGDMHAGIKAADAAWNYAVKGHFDSFKPRVLMSRGTLRAGLGQYRESVEQNMLAASWGRRMGSLFDYEAALVSAVADLFTLAEYERAIATARETREAALRVPNMRDVSKSLEMEGLTYLHLGNYEAACELFFEARRSLEGRGFDDLIPRLLWHEGRVCMDLGQFIEAEGKLTEALKILEQTKDYEDLPGVQVEMQILFSRARDQRLDPEELRRLLENARGRELGTTRLRAAVALGEIVVTNLERPGDALEVLMDELRFAETAGADEFVWRLTYWISRILRGSGDIRSANARLASAVRIAREVASKLTPEHRSTYLATPHARLLLAERESSQTA